MNPPSSTREALLFEALGDMAALIERMDKLLPALDEARRSLLNASTQLSGQVAAFETRMNLMSEQAQAATVKFVAKRADRLMEQALQAHLPAVRQAAHAALVEEIQPALQTLQFYAQRLDAYQRRRRWWQW
jgi:hypothetical protein